MGTSLRSLVVRSALEAARPLDTSSYGVELGVLRWFPASAGRGLERRPYSLQTSVVLHSQRRIQAATGNGEGTEVRANFSALT